MKRLFSQLDPAISKAQGEAIGEIGIALRYKPDKELLLVRVLAAQGLASRQVARKSVDPQVRLTDSKEFVQNFKYITYLLKTTFLISSSPPSPLLHLLQVEVLLLDNVEDDVAKTTVKKNCTKPVWNEILLFKLDEEALEVTARFLEPFYLQSSQNYPRPFVL